MADFVASVYATVSALRVNYLVVMLLWLFFLEAITFVPQVFALLNTFVPIVSAISLQEIADICESLYHFYSLC